MAPARVRRCSCSIVVHDERGLRGRLTHHELLRPGASVRSSRIRAGALLHAGTTVRRDVPGVRVRRAAAVRRRWLATAIPGHGGRHVRPGQVHDVRLRLRQPCAAGTTCFSCTNHGSMFAACTTTCTGSPDCHDATLPLCQSGSQATRTGCSARQRTSRATRNDDRLARAQAQQCLSQSSTIGAAIALSALLAPAAAFASAGARLVPPPLPFAVADAEATVAIAAQSDGGVAAVELSSGRIRWRSTLGRWPLASAQGWVAVGTPDSAEPRALRVRFLRPTDGKLIVASAPICCLPSSAQTPAGRVRG